MPPTRLVLRILVTVAAGLSGAGIGLAIGLPAPALLGSTLAVTAASLAGLPVVFPDRLRDLAFATVGCSLGTGLTPDFVSDLARWPASLALLCVTMLGIMLLSARILTRGFGIGPTEALLATSPGALSYAIALGAEGGHDLRPIMVLQSLRLLLITLSLPLALTGLGFEAAGAAVPDLAGYGVSLAMIGLAYGIGWATARLGMPAAFFLAGIVVSGGAHVTEVIAGRMPPPLVFAGFVMIGCVIGVRFATIPLAALRRYAGAALVVVLAATVVAALAAFVGAAFVGVPFAQAWVAFAPGGVEAMAAMALSLGYDPAFVATHHLVRIVFLIVALPLVVRFGQRAGLV